MTTEPLASTSTSILSSVPAETGTLELHVLTVSHLMSVLSKYLKEQHMILIKSRN